MSEKNIKKKILGMLIIVGSIITVAILTYDLCVPVLRMSSNPLKFREYIDQRGIVGIISFCVAMILQVIAAVIPGGPFQIAAGYAFGMIKGALIADISTTIGSLLVFVFVRKFGIGFAELFFSYEKIKSIRFLQLNKKKEIVLFMLFLIPGTPKDLLSYGVGLTDIKLRDWLFITFVGRFPAILISTYSGSAMAESNKAGFAAAMGVTLILAAIGSVIYIRWSNKENEKTDSRQE
ncbi:TVP38/TMEM64 family protein (plasmid) [Lachnospiraceae bacterium C1.1]|nr:TVP38/TMEM64 family protein [Lachnospiraceae bacterium C1.1]